jgi:hypothetical protein
MTKYDPMYIDFDLRWRNNAMHNIYDTCTERRLEDRDKTAFVRWMIGVDMEEKL